MRSIANERGITLNELQVIAEKDKSVDDEIDERQKRLGQQEKDFVFEGRLGYHFIPDSYKAYLKTNTETAAERIIQSMQEENEERKKEGLTKDKDEIIKSLERRRESEKKRYQDYYGIDYEDEENYDLIIDTSRITAEEVANILIMNAKKHHEEEQEK